MRRPLSIFTYYLRNKRRVVPVLLILSLAVGLMMVVQSLVSSARDTAFAIFGSYQQVEVVAPRVKSQVDAFKPISDAIDTLHQERSRLAAGGLVDDGAGLGSVAKLLSELQGLPERLRAALPAPPDTGPLRAGLGAASKHGTDLQGDLDRLGADLRSAQARQSEQVQLAAAEAAFQKNPNDPAPLLDYFSRPHDYTALTRPDTTDYQAIQDEAHRASADAGALVADLGAVRGQLMALAAVTAKPISLPPLPKDLGRLPGAGDALKSLGDQLGSLETRLGTLTQAQGNIQQVEDQVRALPGVARVERDTYANIDLTLLAGNANFDLYGLDVPAMEAMLRLYGDRVASGRLPRQDAPEVVLSEEVARARGVSIGGVVGSDVNELDSLPEHFKVVGLLSGPVRLGFIPRQYMVGNYFFSRRFQALLVFPGRAGPGPLRGPLHHIIEGQPYRVFDGAFVADKIDSLLVNLQKINDLLTLTVGLTLALVIGLLNNLYFRQRMNEFGLLAAIGYPRRRLVRRVALEGATVIAAAVVLGALLGTGVLAWFNAAYMVPHGLVLRVFDPGIALRAALPLGVMVLVVSTGTLMLQLARLDPIAIIERRD